MFMDVSSEMIHALLPVYLVSVMGASTTLVGVIEGMAESTAAITKVFSGALSDWLGKRKLLAVIGYGLAAVSKPIFPLASTVGAVTAARFIDRIGKGIRGAPRDALVADLAPADARAASFGLRQALDTIGACVGPALAMLCMWLVGGRYRLVFWIAVLPAFLSFALIAIAVREPPRAAPARKARFPLHRDELARLGARYWFVVTVAVVFSLARCSEAFLVLRAQAAGLSAVLIPAALVIMNLVYAAAAYPAGAWADGGGRYRVLASGLVVLVLADLVLALVPGVGGALGGAALWGLHLAFTQGLLAALVADTAPAPLRGTAFGVFNLLTGVALLFASLIAGWLWDMAGPRATFLAGAAFAALALAGLLAVPRRLRRDTDAARA